MEEELIRSILETARTVDPQLQGRWIVEQTIAAVRQLDAERLRQHPEVVSAPDHPHGADYARAIHLNNAYTRLKGIKNEILKFTHIDRCFEANFGGLPHLLAPGDLVFLERAMQCISTVADSKREEAMRMTKTLF